MASSRSIKIGCGSAYADDPLYAAGQLAASGRVDYMGFDCLAERTMALAQIRKLQDPSTGQDRRIAQIVPLMKGLLERGGKVIGSFGAANPDAAADDFAAALTKLGLADTRIGVIRGDDVLAQVLGTDYELPELRTTTAVIRDRIVSANAYIGSDAIVDCLEEDAQIVLGGRLADPSLFVAPICYEMGWKLDDWDRVADATLAGHLLECGEHGTGGNYEDPPYRVVTDPHNIGYPMAEIDEDGIVITKLDGTGGLIDRNTVRVQLYYEIHDPAAYLTPDITADFTQVSIEEIGPDRVRIGNALGRERPARLKVLVGVDQGWKSVGEFSYGGLGCVERAQRAAEIVRKRLERLGDAVQEVLIDLQGVSSLHQGAFVAGYPAEVRLRVATRCSTREAAAVAASEVETLYNHGPAGGGGAVTSIARAIGVTPALVPRDEIKIDYSVVTS
jgi:Acyclic terpene utilisation family protein AtuA